jgi:hypothetical protein
MARCSLLRSRRPKNTTLSATWWTVGDMWSNQFEPGLAH